MFEAIKLFYLIFPFLVPGPAVASLVELGPEMMVLVVCVPASTATHQRTESLQHLVWDIQLAEHRGEANTRLCYVSVSKISHKNLTNCAFLGECVLCVLHLNST